jgi:hypothetical protein
MRKRLLFGFFVLTSISLLQATAFADVSGSTNNNASIDIPDPPPFGNGVPNSASTVTITQNEIIEEATFTIEGLSHRWAGDLVARVEHVESGRSVTLFSRIGKDNRNIGVGSHTNFQGDYAFSDATTNRLWDEAGLNSSDYVLRNLEGNAADPQSNPGIYRATTGIRVGAGGVDESDVTLSINNVFAGLSTEGTWVLDISDRNATIEGSFREFTVDFESVAVPEPSTLVLLMAAGVAGIGIRRRRS